MELDDRTKAEIEAGHPIAIIRMDKKGNVIEKQAYNMQNVCPDKYAMESLAKAIIDDCREKMKDPKYIEEFEKWKAERDSAEKAKK